MRNLRRGTLPCPFCRKIRPQLPGVTAVVVRPRPADPLRSQPESKRENSNEGDYDIFKHIPASTITHKYHRLNIIYPVHRVNPAR